MEVLSLLRSRNRCLRRFLAVTEEYTAALRPGAIPETEDLESERESLVNATRLFETRLSETVPLLPETDRTPELISQVADLENERKEILEAIAISDQKLITRIQEAQELLLEQAQASKKTKSQIGKFKSTWIQDSGSELDEKV